MRLLLEVLGSNYDQARFPIKNGNGKTETVPFYWISGVDADYFDQVIKIKVYRPQHIDKLKNYGKKGNQLQVRFRNMKLPTKYENCIVINANESDIQLHGNGAPVETPAEVN